MEAMHRPGVRSVAAFAALAGLAGWVSPGCTTTTVFGKTPTPSGTWTPIATWTAAATWTPLPTATVPPFSVSYRIGSFQLAVYTTPVARFVAPMAEVYDSQTVSDIVGARFDVNTP